MKTLKFALVAAIVACTMISFANADGFTGKPKALKVITLTIEKAVTVPGLAQAMYAQIDPEELLNSPSAILVAKVVLNGTEYRIRGTRDQWIRFFQHEGNLPFSTAKGFGTN
jgi:hypothetical protein